MQFWQAGQIFRAQLPELIWKKVHKKCKNFSKVFFSKCSYGEVESSLKAPLIFLHSRPKFFRSLFKKKFLGFARDFHPKVSLETENPILAPPPIFFRESVKKSVVSKNEKIWKQNCSPLKSHFGHVKCSSKIPVEKLAEKPKTSCSLSKIDESFHLFSKTVFSSKWVNRYKECSFDRPAKLFLLNYRIWSEKKSTKNAKTLQK